MTYRRCSLFQFDSIVLYHRIGQDVLCDPFNLSGSFVSRHAAVQGDFEILALAHVPDPFEPYRIESMVDSFALRVENGSLQCDVYLCFHILVFEAFVFKSSFYPWP